MKTNIEFIEGHLKARACYCRLCDGDIETESKRLRFDIGGGLTFSMHVHCADELARFILKNTGSRIRGPVYKEKKNEHTSY